jgi:DNA-binding GntR family transcriptional regulator
MPRSEAPRPLNIREAQILRALLPGSQLTVEQLARANQMREHTVRRTVRTLDNSGLLVGGVGLRRTGWQTAPLARLRAATRRGRITLGIRDDEAAS